MSTATGDRRNTRTTKTINATNVPGIHPDGGGRDRVGYRPRPISARNTSGKLDVNVGVKSVQCIEMGNAPRINDWRLGPRQRGEGDKK